MAVQAAEELVTAPIVLEGRVIIASQTETVFAVDRRDRQVGVAVPTRPTDGLFDSRHGHAGGVG